MMQYSELEPASLVKIIKWVRKELKKEDKKNTSIGLDKQLRSDGEVFGLVDIPSKMKKERKSCDYKVRYADKEEAEEALRRYRGEVLFTTMVSYRCMTHDCYHLGHDRFMRKDTVLKCMQAV